MSLLFVGVAIGALLGMAAYNFFGHDDDDNFPKPTGGAVICE